jgi:hypothetical protein
MTPRQVFRRLAGAALAALAVLSVSGCGGMGCQSEITGEVRLDDQLVTTGGSVRFLGADKKEVATAVATNGTYRITGVAPGTARVAFVGHPPVPKGLSAVQDPEHPGGAPPGRTDKGPRIPARYNDPATSELTCEVTGGAQRFNIEMRSP